MCYRSCAITAGANCCSEVQGCWVSSECARAGRLQRQNYLVDTKGRGLHCSCNFKAGSNTGQIRIITNHELGLGCSSVGGEHDSDTQNPGLNPQHHINWAL